MGVQHLRRLQRAASLAAGTSPVMPLFSGRGFTDELTTQAARSGGKIQLVGLERLYRGS